MSLPFSGFPRRFAAIATAVTLQLIVSGPSVADVCVSCTGPDASYACAIEGAASGNDDPRIKLMCMTELAKSGGHKSCQVSRAVTAPCPGTLKTIAAPGLDGPTIALPAHEAPPPAGAQNPETVIQKSGPPPKTVQRVIEDGASNTGDAMKKTGEGASDLAESAGGAMEKAGKAVGDAAKTTWKCLSTLFGEC